jgi:trimeric autotransporter adhesin
MHAIKVNLLIKTASMFCLYLPYTVLSQNVGIGTNEPQAQLHVHGNQTGQGNVLFTGEFKISNPGPPPASGPGTRMMWYPDKAVFRAGVVEGEQWDNHNMGRYSFAFGLDPIASGLYSISMGDRTIASGIYSIAMGDRAEALSTGSIAIGPEAKARTREAISLGKNEANGIRSVSIGFGTRAYGENSVAIGSANIANALRSTAMGYATQASGIVAFSLGFASQANGSVSLAAGVRNLANGYASTVIGLHNDPLIEPEDGPTSTTPLFIIGNGSSINSRTNALVVRNNGRMGLDNANDPLYRLSITDNNLGIDRPAANTMAFYTNGTERLRLTGNGRVGIGLTNPGAPLEVSNENAMVRITNPTGGTTGIEFLRSGGGDDWRLHNTAGVMTLSQSSNDLSTVTDLYGFTVGSFRPATDNSVSLGVSNRRWSSVFATNGTIQTSDARLKENIQPLNYGLQTVAQLRPVSYRWKDNPAGDAHLGFLAQEMQALIPEAVHDAGNGQPLGMQYSELIPVLVKAIQEQEALMESIKATIEKLNARIEILETINKK